MKTQIVKVALGLLVIAPCVAAAQEANVPEVGPAPACATPAYYETEELMQDCLNAASGPDEGRLASAIKGMEIPNYKAWFAQKFGPDEGVKLASWYEANLQRDETGLRDFFRTARAPITIVAAAAHEAPTQEEGPLMQGLRQALQEATKGGEGFFCAYGERRTDSHNRAIAAVGCFTMIEGEVRWLSPSLLSTLSTYKPIGAAPTTLGPGSIPDTAILPAPSPAHAEGEKHSVQQATLIKLVQPKYPRKARSKRIQGVVKLHAILGKDGLPKNVCLISGDPLLTQAAVDAVRKWRYKPTLLDGRPVDVDTTIRVVFELKSQ